MTTERSRPIWLVPVVLVPLLLGLPFLFGKLLLFRDILHFFVPLHVFIAEALRHGRLPQWNPLLYGGYPLLAEPDAGVFYPPNLLFQLAPPATAATLFVVLHLPIAAGGTYLLARALGRGAMTAAIAATGYVTSGYLLSMHGGHLYLASAALLPFAVALLVRLGAAPSPRRVALAALGVALLVLNGDLQAVFFASFFGLALALAADPATRASRLWASSWVLGAIGLGASLAAMQMWPAVLLAQTTVRAHGVPLEEAASWALSPVRWLDFLLPMPFGISYPDNSYWGAIFVDSVHHIPWAPSLYLSPLFILLPFATIWRTHSTRDRVLFTIGICSLLLAAGTALPFFAWWHRFMPLGNLFRYPEKFALPTTLVLVLLGAAALEARPDRETRTHALLFFGVAATLVAVATWMVLEPAGLESVIARGLVRSSSPSTAAEALGNLTSALWHVAIACVAFGLILGVVRKKRPQIVQWALLALVLVDGIVEGGRVLSFGDGTFLSTPPPIADQLRTTLPPASPGRFWRDRSCSFPGGGEGTLLERVCQWEWRTGKENYLGLFGLADAIGYGAAESRDKIDVFHAAGRGGGLRRALRLFGTADTLECDTDGSVRVTPIENPLPHVFFASPEQVSRGQMLQLLADPGFDFTSSALVDDPVQPSMATAEPTDAREARATVVRPEDVEVQTAGSGGFLVLADSFADGWTATVDGVATPIWKVDGLWRGLQVPPGNREVRFRYRTPGLSSGALVSIITLLLLCVLYFLPHRGRGALDLHPAEEAKPSES
jgi:hypothetical protein